MTREEARKAAEVMLAYANGEEIESLSFGKYIPCESPPPSFNWVGGKGVENYRIKPKPKYRPFKDMEECWDEMHKHPDLGWVMNKSKEYLNITEIFLNGINFPPYYIGKGPFISETYNFNKSFSHFTFTDGEPFGVKEE